MKQSEHDCKTWIWSVWDLNETTPDAKVPCVLCNDRRDGMALATLHQATSQPMSKRGKKSLLYETELSWFILVGALDVFMTYLILRYSAEGRTQNVMIEGNPVARWVLHMWGIRGMVIFKFVMIAVALRVARQAQQKQVS